MTANVAFVFPGQGSQNVGMFADLAVKFPLIRNCFATASQVLNYDLWEIVVAGPAEILNQTTYTQLAMLVADIAMWRLCQEQTKVTPVVVAGHSLGEYAALVAAGAIEFVDVVELVNKRAQLMQEAVPPGVGAMAAILGLTAAEVKQVCAEVTAAKTELANKVVQAVNYNSPQQTVIAGHTVAVEQAMQLAKNKGAKIVKKLPVSVPAHSILMQPAAEKLAQFLQTVTVTAPKIPVINNTAVTMSLTPNEIKNDLVRQLFCPVRWVEIIEFMLTHHQVGIIAECGPGKVLTSLSKRIKRELQLYTLNSVDTFTEFKKNFN